MKSWLHSRTSKHRSDVASIRSSCSAQWTANELPDVATIAPQIVATESASLDQLRRSFPTLDPSFVEFISECSSYPIFGMSSDDSFRMLEANRIALLSKLGPKIIANWNSGPAKPVRTPRLTALANQDPNAFDATELPSAIVLAAGDRGCDPALLWMPAPRKEYWLLASWDGCLRFSNIRDAFDHLLTTAADGIRASLS